MIESPIEQGAKNDFPIDESAAQAYKKVLGLLLSELNLSHIQVSGKVHERDSHYYDSRLTLALIGDAELAMATLVSSNPSEDPSDGMPIETFMLVPGIGVSPLLQDPINRVLYADLFVAYEQGEVRLVRPTRPVPVDGMIPFIGDKEDYQKMDGYLAGNEALNDLTCSKIATRELFSQTEAPIPYGDSITRDHPEQIKEKIELLFKERPDAAGVVVKGDVGSQGKQVRMFTKDEIEGAIEFANGLFSQGNDVVLEERILPILTEKTYYSEEGNVVEIGDYNFRVITSLGFPPTVVDTEVRIGKSVSGNPVNVSQGATAKRVDAFFTNEATASIILGAYTVSKFATHVLRAHLRNQGLDAIGIIGMDIIPNPDGEAIIIEANAGPVGGFGSLCKIDKSPLTSISRRLIPSTRDYLERNHTNRLKRGEPTSRLPLISYDYDVLCDLLTSSKKGSAVEQNLATTLSSLYPESAAHIARSYLYKGDYEQALDYFQRATVRKPKDMEGIVGGMAYSLRMLGRLPEAAYVLDTAVLMGPTSPELVIERAKIDFLMYGDRNEFIRIVREALGDGVSDVDGPFVDDILIAQVYKESGPRYKYLWHTARGFTKSVPWIAARLTKRYQKQVFAEFEHEI